MNALISFIYGALVKIVDDIYDNNILLKYKYVFVTALLLLTTYIVFFTKDLYILWIIALGIMGSIVGLFHAPLIDILPWKLSIMIGLTGFIYRFSSIKAFVFNFNVKDIIFLIIYLGLCGIAILIEDKVITEEYSKRKLIIRLLGALFTLGILFYREKIKKIVDVSDSTYDIFIWTRIQDLGYVLCSIMVIIYHLYFNTTQSSDIKSSD